MKKLSIFGLSIVLVCFFACSGNKAGDPKYVAKAFYEAMANKDYDKAAQLATRDSKTLIDLLKSLNQLGNQPEVIFSEEGDEKINSAVYSDAIIDGDKATVKITIDKEEKLIKLKKEDGTWKVALDKEAINSKTDSESGIDLEERNARMDKSGRKDEEIPTDSIQNTSNKSSELKKATP